MMHHNQLGVVLATNHSMRLAYWAALKRYLPIREESVV